MTQKFFLLALMGSLLAHGAILSYQPHEAVKPVFSVKPSHIVVTYKKKTKKVVTTKKKSPSKRKVTKRNDKVTARPTAKVFSEAMAHGTVSPDYPYLSRLNGEEGKVSVKVFISETGKPENVHVIASSGYNRLDEEAKRVVLAASFSPARQGNQTVKSEKEMTFTFKLE